MLRRMLSLGYITQAEFDEAMAAPLTARVYGLSAEVEAPYVAEMVRAEMVTRFGTEEAYTGGYRVYTSLDSNMQRAANSALRSALLSYDERHGYRGPLAQLEADVLEDPEQRAVAMAPYRPVAGLLPAVVVSLEVGKDVEPSGEEEAKGVRIYLPAYDEERVLPWEGIRWARPFLSRNAQGRFPSAPGDVFDIGDVIRVRETSSGLRLAQVPEPEGTLVAVSPKDGGILALAGGFDFFHSRFNRATQAQRQPGSSFKPFVYAAALDKGYTPATIVNDAPVVFEDAALEGTWRPENYSGRFYGPTRLRDALAFSRNLVSIRVMQSIGVGYTVDYMERFGFDPQRMPRNLSLSLGSPDVTPLEITSAYAVFANGGYRVEPWFIDRIERADGEVLYRAAPLIACDDCIESSDSDEGWTEVGFDTAAADDMAAVEELHRLPMPEPSPAPRTLSAQNAYLMNSMLMDVVRQGTGRRLLQLGRSDLAGKTGTTNEQRDAWFVGYNGDVVATAWVGFDQSLPLGAGETGSSAALPMWLEFVRVALDGKPERVLPQPEGIVTVRIDPDTGLVTSANNPRAIFEIFMEDNVPAEDGGDRPSSGNGGGPSDSLF
ncbi:penicillin-binding protein 1A [Alkalilimnicola ehrlichii]|uniref:penicillin-binding protein 1A n=1 Tax=Alkalilimnicola ehrlichii TaxID=351052 RepID=UPI002163A87A|nr:penicillin-binding transpeptidase domain-containing protein [Alkalilimnicola ehrlichii]